MTNMNKKHKKEIEKFQVMVCKKTLEVAETLKKLGERPSVIYKPSIYIDGDKWCVLYGVNVQDGVAGFGDSPEEAIADFDKNWVKKLGEE